MLASMSSPPPIRRTVNQVQAALDAAVRGIAELGTVDDVLQVIVDRVRDLVGAQYAAIGYVDATGAIERFIASGIGRGRPASGSAICRAAMGCWG